MTDTFNYFQNILKRFKFINGIWITDNEGSLLANHAKSI